TCGSVSAGVHTACSSSGTGWNQPTIRAMQPDFSVAVQAYNSYGQASLVGSGTFEVNTYQPSHVWLTDGLSYPDGPSGIPDTVGGTDLVLSPSGTSWVSTQYPGEDTDTGAPTG